VATDAAVGSSGISGSLILLFIVEKAVRKIVSQCFSKDLIGGFRIFGLSARVIGLSVGLINAAVSDEVPERISRRLSALVSIPSGDVFEVRDCELEVVLRLTVVDAVDDFSQAVTGLVEGVGDPGSDSPVIARRTPFGRTRRGEC